MKIGLQLHNYNFPAETPIAIHLGRIAQAAEATGFDSLWVLDHFMQMEGAGAVQEPMLEAYTVLGYIAALTRTIELGVTVTGVIYRYPAILLKTLTTLDVLTQGRAWLGIGAAWYEREARGYGVPFPTTKERFAWLEETLQLAHQMFNGEDRPFHGQHLHLTEPLNYPRPVRRPPIMVGGDGEQKTLRLVAQYADACNVSFGIGKEGLQHKFNVLRGHCEAVGRDYHAIEKTTVGTAGKLAPAEFIDLCGMQAELGVQHIIVNLPHTHEIALLEAFGRDVLPTVKKL